MSQTRRLAAILAADVAGYSRLMGVDEESTLAALKAVRREVVDPKIAEHRGRIVKTTGDGLLTEFQSVVDALRCAVSWQAAMPADSSIAWRIGINVGDIVVDDGDIFGDGVNVAARLEALAEPGGICVSARVQEDAAGRLDLAFEDMGEQSLKNIARPVRVLRVRANGSTKSSAAAEPVALPLPDKPSIAVLPFQNMSGDPEQEYFADGMVEEIITALSRIRWLFVIARNSSFTYKGRAVDVKQIGRELGVRYLLEGSVRKGGSRVRITAQLLEAATGVHIWADRFDGPIDDVFDLQDKVATSVAGVIEPALQVAETERSARSRTSDLTAYDLYLRAWPLMLTWAKDQVEEALALLEQAIERDQHYGPALAVAAFCHFQRAVGSWTGDFETERRLSVERARQAVQFAGEEANAIFLAAGTLGNWGDDLKALTELVDSALARNPSSALGWFWSGHMRLWAGNSELAIEHFEHSQRLDPRPSLMRAFRLYGIGVAHFLERRFDQAAHTLQASLHELPTYPSTLRCLAACYAYMGRLDDARETILRLREIAPSVLPIIMPYRVPAHRELLLSGLRLAMGETA